MVSFYSQETADRMGKRARISLWMAVGLLAAALIACITLCTQVRTANAQRLLYIVIGQSTLAGWTFILLFTLVYRPSLGEYRHMTNILSGEEETFQGRLTLSPMAFQIPKSILVRKVTLTDGEETHTLNVDARFAQRLPENGTAVRVRAVKKYITAVDVLHENV